MTTTDYKTHVMSLARQHRVAIVLDCTIAPDMACASPDERKVIAHDIVDETTYAVVLHELGHVVAPGGVQRIPERGQFTIVGLKTLLEEEDAAWTWARSVALDWTPAMEHVAAWARSTYAEHLKLLLATCYLPPVKGKPLSALRDIINRR